MMPDDHYLHAGQTASFLNQDIFKLGHVQKEICLNDNGGGILAANAAIKAKQAN